MPLCPLIRVNGLTVCWWVTSQPTALVPVAVLVSLGWLSLPRAVRRSPPQPGSGAFYQGFDPDQPPLPLGYRNHYLS